MSTGVAWGNFKIDRRTWALMMVVFNPRLRLRCQRLTRLALRLGMILNPQD